MLNLNHLGIGGLLFVIGAILYVINLALAFGKRRGIPIDGIGLMVLGIGLALLLKM
jgi:hypothetical protein